MNMLMEKRCEFCSALCPIVYCKADAAQLCLSCDLKVHSANTLSYRHPRTLVCESCRCNPAQFRCFDHEMFMCQSCDASHHVSCQHRKTVISCYVGCPSAKDLAALWGFEFSKLENRNPNVSKASPQSVIPPLVSGMDGVISALYTESQVGSSSLAAKVFGGDRKQQSSYLILQQIHDLERLQLSEGIDNPGLARAKQRMAGSPFWQDMTWKLHKTPNTSMEHPNKQLDFQSTGGPLEVKNEEPLPSPFSQLDSLTSAVNLLPGESLWQCKSPNHNNEIWLQNMQDLGVCDEAKWLDDVNIPDVDLTFRNYEELFGSEHDPGCEDTTDDDMECSFADKSSSFAQIDRGCASTTEEIPGPSPACHQQLLSGYVRGADTPHTLQPSSSLPTWPSHSTSSSFTVSRMTGESSGSEYKDDGLSRSFPKPHDSENAKLQDGKGNHVIMRYKYKEKKTQRHAKKAQDRLLRSKSDMKKRGKGHQTAMKAEGSLGVTRSF